MKRAYYFITTLFFLPGFITFPLFLHAGEIEQTSSIFKFQQRLAEQGNPRAQYRLGALHETGIGTVINKAQAKHWYALAAESLPQAEQRMAYLEIKQRGFDKSKDTRWLNSVKESSKKTNPEARYLLAQLYRQGIGVQKDLNKALDLLNQISVFEIPYVDREIALIQAEKATKQRHAQGTKHVIEQETPVPLPTKKEPIVTQAEKQADVNKNKKQAAVQIDEAQRIAEKRQRYEKAMLQLKREQQLIDELQSSVSDDQKVGVDEEF